MRKEGERDALTQEVMNFDRMQGIIFFLLFYLLFPHHIHPVAAAAAASSLSILASPLHQLFFPLSCFSLASLRRTIEREQRNKKSRARERERESIFHDKAVYPCKHADTRAGEGEGVRRQDEREEVASPCQPECNELFPPLFSPPVFPCLSRGCSLGLCVCQRFSLAVRMRGKERDQ